MILCVSVLRFDMRSVFVYVKDATKESVVSCLPTLKNIHTSRIGLPWIYNIEGETYLYVDVNDEPASEYEAEEWQEIVAQFAKCQKLRLQLMFQEDILAINKCKILLNQYSMYLRALR